MEVSGNLSFVMCSPVCNVGVLPDVCVTAQNPGLHGKGTKLGNKWG